MYSCYIKRVIDLSISILGLILCGIPMCILAILIICSSRGPIIFKQKRRGQGEAEFYIYKFRTMKSDTPSDVPTHLLEDPNTYVTGIGKFMRKTSLDELPQIFNIIKGQMAIIGPRPALWNQNDLIALREESGANKVKPGLTGWAQINGRDEISIVKKAEFDAEYVENITFIMDMKIFLLTILKVIKKDGIQ